MEKSKNTKTASDSLKQYAENDGINEFIDSDDEPLEETNQESEVEVEEEVITERILGTTPVARLTLGSISLALGHPVDGFTSLPTWAPADQPLLADPSVRDEPVQAQSGIGSTSIISHASDTSRYGQTTPHLFLRHKWSSIELEVLSINLTISKHLLLRPHKK